MKSSDRHPEADSLTQAGAEERAGVWQTLVEAEAKGTAEKWEMWQEGRRASLKIVGL